MNRVDPREAVDLLRSVCVTLWYVLLAILALLEMALRSLLIAVTDVVAVFIAVPIWLFLWLKWWRRTHASS